MRLRHTSTGVPFPVKVTVRSKEHERLIVGEAATLGFMDSAKVGF